MKLNMASCSVNSTDENINVLSQSSHDLNKEALDEIEKKAQAKNTTKATAWGLKRIEQWSVKRNTEPQEIFYSFFYK